MNGKSSCSVIYSGKPGRLQQPVRFFLLIMLTVFAACNSGKQLSRKGSAGVSDGNPRIQVAAAVLQNRDSTDGIFMEAVKARILNNKEEAFRKYALFSSLYPGNAAAHYELSRLWFERNNLPSALDEIRLALQQDSVNKWMQKQYADLLSFDGKYVEAAAVYERIASRERSPEDYLMREVILFQKAEKYKEALSVLDRLELYIGEDDETLIMQREQLYLAMNDVESAAGEIRKLIKFYPEEARYILMLAELYENNNIDEKARKAYEDAERLFPGDVSVQFALVQFYLKQKDEPKVEYYLEKAILNRDAGVEDRIGLLVPFIQYRGADTSARRIAFNLSRKLADQQPPQIDAVSLYGDLLLADGQAENALQQYKYILSLDSTKFPAWQQIMYIYTTRSENDSLIAYSERAVRIFPQMSMAYYLGGIGYMQLKKNTEAIDFLNKAIRFQTNNNDNLLSDMLVSLGDVYNTESRFASSDSCYNVALILQPDNATALNNYSYYLSVRGENLEEAAKMSEKSLKLRPGESTFLDTYGWILFKLGKYTEAKEYILKAIASNKENGDPTLWEHLGDIEYKLGNTQQALEHWKMALSKGEVSDSLQQKINEQKLHE